MSNEFKREERYVVLKIKDLEFSSPSVDINKRSKELGEWISRNSLRTRECVVVESDWPEYNLVWTMLEHRMAGKPVPNFNDWRRADELQQRLTAADERNDEAIDLLRRARAVIAGGGWADLERDIAKFLNIKSALKPAETVAGHHPACRAVDDYKPGECSHGCKPASQPQGEPVEVVLPEFEPAFEKWWEEDGQYCRAGGGSYEKTFAYRAYEAALADVTRLNTK